MSRIVCLDMGDVWVGMAISDPMRIIAQPYKTVKIEQLNETIKELLATYEIAIIVVGYPKTLKGTHSAQTEKVIKQKEALELEFPQLKFVLWDERLTSKQAEKLKKTKSKEDKIKSHSLAAAFILDTYLQFVTL